MWVLAKERREDENAVLAITGRDIEQNEFTLQFDKRSCMWRNLGNTDDFTAQQARAGYENNPIVVTVRKLLEQSADRRWSGTASDLMTAFYTPLRPTATLEKSTISAIKTRQNLPN